MNDNSETPDILVPGADPGMAMLRAHPIAPDYAAPAHLLAVVAASDPAQEFDIYRFIRAYRFTKGSGRSAIFASFPVVVDDYELKGKLTRLGGKLFFSGAAALRTMLKVNRNTDGRSDEVIEGAAIKARRKRAALPVLDDKRAEKARHLPFVIEAKNYFNYYHFVTEALIYLQMYRDYGLTGPIHFVSGSKAPKKSFIERLVADLYPDLAARVVFLQGQQRESRVILPYCTNFLYHQTHRSVMPDLDLPVGVSDEPAKDAMRPATIANYKFIYNNSRDAYIDRHRQVVTQALDPDLPGIRVYVGRKPGAGKERDLLGEEKMCQMLARYDFQHVHFEDLTPREQAQLCARADVLISAHGAGFANMLYAKPGAYFIELSHLQTARHRFGDFNMHAAASGARHLHFFADHAVDDVAAVPNIEEGHAGIAMSDHAIDRLEGLIAMVSDPRGYKNFMHRITQAAKAQDHAAVVQLFQSFPQYEKGCVRACLAAVDAYIGLNQQDQALAYLQKAAIMAPFRRDALDRLEALAKDMELPQVVAAAQELIHRYRMFRWLRWSRDFSGATVIQAPATKRPE